MTGKIERQHGEVGKMIYIEDRIKAFFRTAETVQEHQQLISALPNLSGDLNGFFGIQYGQILGTHLSYLIFYRRNATRDEQFPPGIAAIHGDVQASISKRTGTRWRNARAPTLSHSTDHEGSRQARICRARQVTYIMPASRQAVPVSCAGH